MSDRISRGAGPRFALRPRVRSGVLAVCYAAPLVCGGCYRQRTGPAGTVRPAGEARVRFADPRSLDAVTPSGDVVRLSGVRVVAGRVARVRGDTVDLDLRGVEPAAGAPTDARVRVALAAGDTVTARRFAPGRTALLVLPLLLAAVAALVVISALPGEGDL